MHIMVVGIAYVFSVRMKGDRKGERRNGKGKRKWNGNMQREMERMLHPGTSGNQSGHLTGLQREREKGKGKVKG